MCTYIIDTYIIYNIYRYHIYKHHVYIYIYTYHIYIIICRYIHIIHLCMYCTMYSYIYIHTYMYRDDFPINIDGFPLPSSITSEYTFTVQSIFTWLERHEGWPFRGFYQQLMECNGYTNIQARNI